MPQTKRLIGLASGVVPEFGPEATIEAASKGGFDMVGLWVEPDQWTDATTRAVRGLLAETGLPVVDVEVIWIKPGAFNPDHKRILDIGAEVGAKNALVVSSDPDMGATKAKYSELCAYGGERNIRVALEFGMFTNVKTIGAALSILDEVDHPASALLIDPIHLSRSGGSPEDVAAVPRKYFSYAQFCDAGPDKPDPDDFDEIIREAVDGRLQTGEGVLPLSGILHALPSDIPLSIELRSKPLRDNYPDPVERARVTAEATRRFLDRAAVTA